MTYLNQSLVLLYQTYKTIILIFQSTILYPIDVISNYEKGLINNQNIDDNECFEQCLVRYLHPGDHNYKL